MATQVKVGLIGAGRIGRVHAENLAYRIPQAHLVAVVDAFEAAAQKCAADFHIPTIAPDPQAIFDDRQIDAVIICSSTDTHAQFIIAAAEAGKHIFCEKPIDFDLAKIDEALAVVDRAGVKLQVGFNRRFDPNFKQVHDWVQEGKVGAPHLVRITSRDPGPPPIEYIKGSGGIFLDMTIHDFDMARYLSGSEVQEIYAAAGVMVDPVIGQAGDVDTAVILLRFANGAIVTIDNSRKAVYGYDQRVEVVGPEGMLQAQNNTPDNDVYSNAEGVQTAKPLYFFLERYVESFIAEQKGFVQSIREDTATPVGGRDGRIAVVMGMAAQKSYQENRPVKLSEIDA